MLLKRIRVVNIAPFLFLRWTPCLLFIFLLTPLENIYAQDDDSGEIFWGEDEEEDEAVSYTHLTLPTNREV